MLQDLRVALGEKERLLKEAEKEKEMWRQRDQALTTVLQEKEVLIHYLKEELESHQKDVQVTYVHLGVISSGDGVVHFKDYKLNCRTVKSGNLVIFYLSLKMLAALFLR